MSDTYDKTKEILDWLRLIAVESLPHDEADLGDAVGHLYTDHPEMVARVLVLAMIDMALLREMIREVASKVVTARGGTPTSDNIDEVLAELKSEIVP